MKLTDFQQQTAPLSDAEFLAHPEVRRVYWKCMGQEGPWKHQWINTGDDRLDCWECKRRKHADPRRPDLTCDAPSIPGSLPDAVEQLRAKVVAGRKKSAARRAAEKVGDKSSACVDSWLAFAGPKEAFTTFAMALGALEI